MVPFPAFKAQKMIKEKLSGLLRSGKSEFLPCPESLEMQHRLERNGNIAR